MYTERGLMYPYYMNFSQEIPPLEELFYYSQEPTSSLDSVVTTSTISDYDLGGGGDLFKAPEPILEKPIGSVDLVTAAIAMIYCLDNVMPNSGLKFSDEESVQNELLFCDVFHGYENELLEKTSVETANSNIVDVEFPMTMINEVQTKDNESHPLLSFSESDSSGYLNSMEWKSTGTVRPNFLDFPETEIGATYGTRKAFSEEDMKQPLVIGSCPSEERLQKLFRYRNKKSRRSFGRKIKYARRKALADSQPRIRGRFAKTEENQ